MIAPAGPAAAAVLAALHAGADPPGWSEAEFAALLRGPGVFARLWLEGGAPRGFVLARTAADEAEILMIAVEPDHRRRGLGAALMAAAVDAAHAAGAAAMLLEVAQDNAAARALYGGRGFTEVGRRRGYYRRSGGEAVDAL
ncbi:MAG TPA: GNAT family N-acetyltransferase, partial [Caulobacteraceae bacterium]|nr:GNAT family N-acetyltransferase [Caulobacteraceae bacterium]